MDKTSLETDNHRTVTHADLFFNGTRPFCGEERIALAGLFVYDGTGTAICNSSGTLTHSNLVMKDGATKFYFGYFVGQRASIGTYTWRLNSLTKNGESLFG